MKWVKTAIGAVIAISVIPMIVLAIFNLTQERVREEVVTFEILTLVGETGTTDIDVYNLINDLVIFNDSDTSTNVISVTVNGIYENEIIYKWGSYFTLGGVDYNINISPNNIIVDDGSPISPLVGDVWEITFEVTTPPVLSGVTATLVSLVSLVFISGILYSFYNVRMKEGE